MTGDQQPPKDVAILKVLQDRDGLASEVVLGDGTRLTVFNIAWGYDFGDEYAHVTTNISPGVAGSPVDLFSTNSVAAIYDPVDDAELFRSPLA
ncbi:hypothetical protein OHB00_25195 [Streptomyces sp. NBC_00631]|uniref:hypothetical protein n=1 Tax=Streptomyces sp. NBC_00631 TaxID=2975793 RepID=UPI0030E4BA2B